MNINIIYKKHDDNYNCFVFTFNDLDNYEICLYVDKETCQLIGCDSIEMVTRFANAYNAFRHWEPRQRYMASEIKKALESIAKKNEGVYTHKVYRFATLGDRPKIAEKMFYELS